jgi:hypothetical protein
MNELKNCPFCGGPATWCAKGYKLMCQWCCAFQIANGIEEGIERWNTRAPDPRVERLVAALKRSSENDCKRNCPYDMLRDRVIHTNRCKEARAALAEYTEPGKGEVS